MGTGLAAYVAISASGSIATSQLALPAAACEQVYAAAGYEASVWT